jgi:hypothetical protein
MNQRHWSARIDTLSNATLGAGFLIDSERVLTCAHVVQGHTEVRVNFPGDPNDSASLKATVEPLTAWAQLGDRGDMALLRLQAPVTTGPAQFAAPTGMYWVGDLRAHGYRFGVEPNGSYATLHTAADMELGAEWWQLHADGPEYLANGFSGAAVYRVDTGEVIGMITDADLKNGGRMGRMLPIPTLRRHWEDLDDLLPLGWLSGEERRTLHEIVRGMVTRNSLRQVYLGTFPGQPPSNDFRSAWDAIRYVAEERFEEDRLSRFLDQLARQAPRDTAFQLARWSQATLGASQSDQGAQRRADHQPTSIIIRLDRRTRGDTYELTFSTLVDGIPGRVVPSIEVRAAQVREEVESRLPTLVRDVIGRDWMIEFALPESWLSKPVEDWKAGPTLMLAYPVVVRDVERLKPTFRQDRAIQRWTLLRRRGSTAPKLVGCSNNGRRDQFFYWLTAHDDVCVLVHAQRPRPYQLKAALNAGMPVMLWPRSTCPGPVHSDCLGERMVRKLAALIASADPDTLPRLVRTLRADARSRPADQPHCGRRLTLFWDDPTRLPDPPLAMPM